MLRKIKQYVVNEEANEGLNMIVTVAIGLAVVIGVGFIIWGLAGGWSDTLNSINDRKDTINTDPFNSSLF